MITVEGQTPAEVDVARLEPLLEAAQTAVGRRGIVRVGLRFADAAQMEELARSYAGSDKATDVLSFESGGDDPEDLGDIVICEPVAKRQAAEHSVSFTSEVELLFLHGVLHLLGLDHDTDVSRSRLEKLQQRILKENNMSGREYL